MVSNFIGKATKSITGFLAGTIITLAVISCATHSAFSEVTPDKSSLNAPQTYSYQKDIQPILNNKCIACHACYDAPCQVKFDHPLGIERGASKIKVYDGTRLKDIEPTRLGIDAQNISQWREQGFFSIIHQNLDKNNQPTEALMKQMIDLGFEHPVASNKPLSKDYQIGINRDNTCANPNEIKKYRQENPLGGMPYGVTGLTQQEHKKLTIWLDQGAVTQTTQPELPDTIEPELKKWEAFLNQPDIKQQLVSRYLYEHWFLAHMYFDHIKVDKPYFFQLIRSYTPAPQPIDVVATVRPNGDPKRPFYYRFRQIEGPIVHKTHITYRLNDKRLQRIKSLFFSENWQLAALPGYDKKFAANPFATFAAIPAKARYQFMLDTAEYFTRTFIRGPVCRGQIATDVIRDQFWIMYEDPESDQFVSNTQYRNRVTPFLGLPGEDSDLLALGTGWLEYQGKRNQYLELRNKQYRSAFPEGATLDSLWDGDNHNDNAFLSIFRHHDSASVRRGWHGKVPRTLWIMDYPLFERTYYELVVGFNVFGSVSHQAQTRLYFDLIRNGGEVNFLRLLPKQDRKAVYDSWYKGSGKIKDFISYHELDVASHSGIRFTGGQNSKNELITLIQEKFANVLAVDYLNQCLDDQCDLYTINDMADKKTNAIKAGQHFVFDSTKRYPGILQLPEVTFVRVDFPNDDYEVYTLMRNRAHTNVAFMLGESLRFEPKKDSITVYHGLISSYPNFIFQVDSAELAEFSQQLGAMQNEGERQSLIERWGVRRTHPKFWQLFHSFSDYHAATDPYQAGYFDLNRYTGW